MTIRYRSSGAWVTPANIRRRASGAWVGVQNIYRRESGAWVKVWAAFSATDSGDAYASRADAGSLSAYHTITPSGGGGSYTYSASWLSGGSSMTIAGGSTASVTVTSSGSGTLTRSGTLRHSVSDGTTTINFDRLIEFTWGTA